MNWAIGNHWCKNQPKSWQWGYRSRASQAKLSWVLITLGRFDSLQVQMRTEKPIFRFCTFFKNIPSEATSMYLRRDRN